MLLSGGPGVPSARLGVPAEPTRWALCKGTQQSTPPSTQDSRARLTPGRHRLPNEAVTIQPASSVTHAPLWLQATRESSQFRCRADAGQPGSQEPVGHAASQAPSPCSLRHHGDVFRGNVYSCPFRQWRGKATCYLLYSNTQGSPGRWKKPGQGTGEMGHCPPPRTSRPGHPCLCSGQS